MRKFTAQLRQLLSRRKQQIGKRDPSAPDSLAVLVGDEDALKQLLHALAYTQDEELSCAETFALLDEYAELMVSSVEAKALMPLVKHHLDHCLECRERYEILLQILQTT
jgi:hypothetical protein